jgi:hypothetical protein
MRSSDADALPFGRGLRTGIMRRRPIDSVGLVIIQPPTGRAGSGRAGDTKTALLQRLMLEIIGIAVEVALRNVGGADHCEKPSAVLCDEGHLCSPNVMQQNVPMTLNFEVRKVTGRIYRYLTKGYKRNPSAFELHWAEASHRLAGRFQFEPQGIAALRFGGNRAAPIVSALAPLLGV